MPTDSLPHKNLHDKRWGKCSVSSIALAYFFFSSGSVAGISKKKGQETPPFFISGLYVGIVVGTSVGNGPQLKDHASNASGALLGQLAGATLGYNLQFPSWLVGVEADMQLLPGITGARNMVRILYGQDHMRLNGYIVNFHTLSSVRLRVGYLLVDGLLFYATGGYSWTNEDVEHVSADGKTDSAFRDVSKVQGYRLRGYIWGAGAEYYFTQNIAIKTEYVQAFLDSRPSISTPGFGSGVSLSFFRLGINYRF